MGDLLYASIGRRMQELRKRRNITQEYIGNKLGTTASYISRLENGKTKIPLNVIILYADLTNSSIDYILFAEREIKPEPHNYPHSSNAQNQQILKLISGYSTKEKEKLISILEILEI